MQNLNSMNSTSRSTSESSTMMTALAVKLSTTDGWVLFVAAIDDSAFAVANTTIGAIDTIDIIPLEWFNKMRDNNELTQQWPNLAPDLYSITNETRESFIVNALA